jgi:hypothetical protein
MGRHRSLNSECIRSRRESIRHFELKDNGSVVLSGSRTVNDLIRAITVKFAMT